MPRRYRGEAQARIAPDETGDFRVDRPDVIIVLAHVSPPVD